LANKTMKSLLVTLLLTFTFLAVPGALGQNVGSISSQVQPVYVPDHPQHATQHAMAAEHSLVGSTEAYSYAQGERPLWEFGPFSEPTPLGDVAREVRKEKLTAKKATIIFEKQGSTVAR